ncbi:uncharacterized protein LOC134288785 [Aedes albopictus]|uniref:Uncharacterized protein n=1 Tax=Aedes albopictus TaxID=7160 RepID=A0ABM1ZB44_AEDAL
MATMAVTIEPYRKGCSFSDWLERLEYSFVINAITDQNKKAYLIPLSGPIIFSELRLLYPRESLSEVTYPDMVAKLKARLDKTESDLVQRMKFNSRVQQQDETAEDFVLSLKLQAEFCSFGEFKQVAIRDRVLAGLTDGALIQRLLNEENLTLQSAEKLIATWEIAGANARTIGSGGASALVASLRNRNPNPAGRSFNKLARVFDLAKNSPRHIEDEEGERRPVKTRLGYKQPYRGQFDYKYRNRAQMDNRHSKDWRRDDGRQPSSRE